MRAERIDSDSAMPGWRSAAATAADAAAIGVLLLLAIGLTMAMLRSRPAALAATAVPFAVLGVLLAATYFLWLGGLLGETLGQRIVRLPESVSDPCPAARHASDLRAIAVRAGHAALADALFLYRLGLWAGRMLTAADSWFAVRSAPWRHPQ